MLLNESGMQDHPLTPMTDPNLVRVLSRQSNTPVGLLDYKTIRKGADAARAHLAALAGDGRRLIIADATDEDDLRTLASATSHQMLSTGGSGLAVGMPAAFAAAGLFKQQGAAADLPKIGGKGSIISGSCSRATNEQVARFARNHPVFQINPLALAEGKDLAAEALEWAKGLSLIHI